MEGVHFDDPIEEAKYWQNKAEEFRQRMEEAREELEDFQISSRDLELELETQLEQLEKRNTELVRLSEKFTQEKENYQNRFENNQQFVNHEITRLQEEFEKSCLEKEKSHRYIRELEQINDDLERTQRATVGTVEDFEVRLNQAIERNVFLENELDEKEVLIVTVQRLKDETRDLHQELANRKRQLDPNPVVMIDDNLNESSALSNSNSNLNLRNCMVQTDLYCANNCILTPSVQLSALNMVNDALQKIGQLETKLSALYRAYGTPPSLSAPPIHTNPGSLNKLWTKELLHNPSMNYSLSPTHHHLNHESLHLSSHGPLHHNYSHDDQEQQKPPLQQQQSQPHPLLKSTWLNGSSNLDYQKLDSTTCEQPPVKVLH